MQMFDGLAISASGLTAQRFRMDVVASNIANAQTTRSQYVDGQWLPYRRKMVQFAPLGGGFASHLQKAMGRIGPGQGVVVRRIVEDPTPFQQVYMPEHPDANAEGYVLLPNVDILKEQVDMLTATRMYEANVTAFQASKTMLAKALEIGRG
ncbi:MAG: flagellar basal body rod protein FlgC [Bacillus thermozeamaize]|uniref:Flagellar basal-body rod protein FlgC n=1 Tax=Bacillus thermozeamaize TaxID=230954 RepID=A0A1Y3PT76_9BACI|nr:MAG: flagellar basal body rod protein FlgC [Bacillus thermozeamaize]